MAAIVSNCSGLPCKVLSTRLSASIAEAVGTLRGWKSCSVGKRILDELKDELTA